MTSTPQEIKSALLLYSVVLLFLITCFIARREYDEKRVLEKQLQLLEDSFRQQQEKNQLQVDSLQQYIELREEVNLKLKDSIRLLQKKRTELNQKADENKASIVRIRDIDSLRHAVARHYR